MFRIIYRVRRRRVGALGGSRRDYLQDKERARDLVLERLAYFNRCYNLKWGRIAIRNQRSRWGSCSKQGNLNFNYRIAHLPPLLQDYLVVHETCHLKEHNHSRHFWELVAETIPSYAISRRELRKVQRN